MKKEEYDYLNLLNKSYDKIMTKEDKIKKQKIVMIKVMDFLKSNHLDKENNNDIIKKLNKAVAIITKLELEELGYSVESNVLKKPEYSVNSNENNNKEKFKIEFINDKEKLYKRNMQE